MLEETIRKMLHQKDGERNSQIKSEESKPRNKNHSSLSKRKAGKCLSDGNGSRSLKKKKIANKTAIVPKIKHSKKKPCSSGLKNKRQRNSTRDNDKPCSSALKNKLKTSSTRDNDKPDDREVKSRKLKRRKMKRKNNLELDEASRLQRRTRYLLIKVKLEQNLIDAYSAEGWKGQSREKIRPEKELLRAKKQILKCKLGIREAIHQLDLLSSEGRINDSAVAPDGSVHHKHIVCAKCKADEALPDNDIILCDGTCNCAFHQKCLDPPLPTENIPQGDEGWFCNFCKKKMEILEATNAHLGTHFPVDSNWEDIFKEEAALPDDENFVLSPEGEWPSDDSEDDDYDPDRIQHSCSESTSRSDPDASDFSSSFLGSLEDESLLACQSIRSFDNSLELVGVDSDELNSSEVLCRPRQRAAVDYIKLYDEIFGKNATENEQISEDEDWGPTKSKRKGKEDDAASTLMTLGDSDKKVAEEMPAEANEELSDKKTKRPIFRLPHNAVEKLRLVFAENELPERALRVSLAKQLGLEFEKVNKWFKNARYLALKARKVGRNEVPLNVSPGIQKEPISGTETSEHADHMESSENTTSEAPKSVEKHSFEEIVKERNTNLATNSSTKQQQRKASKQIVDNNKMNEDLGDDVSLKLLRQKVKEAKKKGKVKESKKKLNRKNDSGKAKAEAEMERLCEVKTRVERLQQVLLQFSSWRYCKSGRGTKSSEHSVVYVPIAELREKR